MTVCCADLVFGCVGSQLQHEGSSIAERGLSSCGAWTLVPAHRLSCSVACGILVPSPPPPAPKDGTRVPCIGRQILNPWATREVPSHADLEGA